MLIVNGTVLNLSQPTTELEKRVKQEMATLRKDYNLANNGINFVFPKEYLRPNKANGGKIDRPASFKIQFRDFLSDDNGTNEWRWCSGMTAVAGSTPVYFPKWYLFTGSWTLTDKDIDLIYYLIKVFSRTKGGSNSETGVKPYIAIEDKVRDANTNIELRKKKNFAETAIMQDEENGGLPEDKLRILASSMFISGADKKDISLLRNELIEIVDKQKGGYELIKKAYDEQASGLGIYKGLVQRLLDNKIVELQTRGTITSYFMIDADGNCGDKITNVKKNSPHAEQLAKFLADDEVTVDILTKALEERTA